MFSSPDNSEENHVNFECGAGGAEDEGRCFEIVRRAVDEETALEMVAAFLLITQDHRVPPTASIHFHSCYFDPASGEIFLINILSDINVKYQTSQDFLS